jgi:hypothetical protein
MKKSLQTEKILKVSNIDTPYFETMARRWVGARNKLKADCAFGLSGLTSVPPLVPSGRRKKSICGLCSREGGVKLVRPKQPRLRLDPELNEQLRNQALRRDGFRCQSCGAANLAPIPKQVATVGARLRRRNHSLLRRAGVNALLVIRINGGSYIIVSLAVDN